MEDVLIRLSTIDDVKDFVSIVSDFDGDVTIRAGRYVIDGKSILGIFSVDLSKVLILTIDKPTSEKLEMIQRFVVQS